MRRWPIIATFAALFLFAGGNLSWAQSKADPRQSHPFMKRLYYQIGSAWYRNVQANSQKLASGTIRIAFTASPDGSITQLRVLSNTSNQLFEQVSLSAIRSAKIPPVPRELLTDGKFENEISFTMSPNPSP
jgi:TonB family protein